MMNISESTKNFVTEMFSKYPRVYKDTSTGEYLEDILDGGGEKVFSKYLQDAKVFKEATNNTDLIGLKAIYVNIYGLLLYYKSVNRIFYYSTDKKFVEISIGEVENICSKDDLYGTVSRDIISGIIYDNIPNNIIPDEQGEEIVLNINGKYIYDPLIDISDFAKQIKLNEVVRYLENLDLEDNLSYAIYKIIETKKDIYSKAALEIASEIDDYIEVNNEEE